LDDNDLQKCCTSFVQSFSQDSKADVDFDDFFSELKVLRVSLPEKLMSATEILRFVKAADCYPNVSFAYRILLTIPVIVASARKKFLQIETAEKLLKINYVTRKIEWFGYV